MMRTITRGMLAVFASSLGYGVLPILAKLALSAGVGVLPLLMWRFLLGTTLIWSYVLLSGRRLPARDRVIGLFGLGLLYALNALAYMLGLDRISASLASIVFFSYPAVTVLLARIWIGEAMSRRRLVALLLASGGCALTIGTGLGGGDARGVGLILVGVLLLASFIVKSHRGLQGVPAVSGAATLLVGTTVFLSVAAFATGGIAVPLEPRALALILAIAVVSTAIPITLFLVGIQWIGPARAAIFSTLEPAWTLSLAAVLLGDRLAGVQWLGASLILAGVIWLRLERTPEEPIPAP